MQPSGVELILTGFGIVASLGGLILLVYRTVSTSIQSRFAEAKGLIAEHEKKLDTHLTNIYEKLRDINGRVRETEISLKDHKENDKDIHDRERRETDRRFIEQMKDVEELKKEVRKGPC